MYKGCEIFFGYVRRNFGIVGELFFRWRVIVVL